MKIKRYADNCYAVVKDKQRGPCAPDRKRAIERYKKSGLLVSSKTDKLTDKELLLHAARIARNARLPKGFLWDGDAIYQFNFGKKRAANAIIRFANLQVRSTRKRYGETK